MRDVAVAETYLNLLRAIALGKHSVSEIARALRLKMVSNTTSSLVVKAGSGSPR